MGYWQRRRQKKLYKQWEKHSELPPEIVPQKPVPQDSGLEEGVMPPPLVRDDTAIGIDVKAGLKEDSWFYQFRVKIRDAVGKLLRVD